MLELVANVKFPELDVACAGPPNCGVTGFSGETEGVPNLKSNENAGFASFGASLCVTAGGLADSPGDGVEVGCSAMNGFWLSFELVAPNPEDGVPDELPNENIDVIGSFCSELVTAGVGSTVEVVEGRAVVETFVDSTVGLWDGRPPNKLGGGKTGKATEAFGGSPPNGAGAGSGVGSTFAEGVGKVGIAGEIVGVTPTGGAGGRNIDFVVSRGLGVVIRPFAPAAGGALSDFTRGVG